MRTISNYLKIYGDRYMKLKVLLMTLIFAVSMVAQTAAPAPDASTGKAKTECSCPNCKDCCKDGKCASGGECCGKDAKCVRKSGDKMAKMDCCKDGKKDCCKEGAKCCGDMAKGEMAKDGKSCCGD